MKRLTREEITEICNDFRFGKGFYVFLKHVNDDSFTLVIANRNVPCNNCLIDQCAVHIFRPTTIPEIDFTSNFTVPLACDPEKLIEVIHNEWEIIALHEARELISYKGEPRRHPHRFPSIWGPNKDRHHFRRVNKITGSV